MKDKVIAVLWIIGIVIAVILTVRYLWPLILVLALIFLLGWWRTKRTTEQAEEEARRFMNETQQDDAWMNGLHDADRQEETAPVIDAEVVDRKETRQ